jgi:vancomycin permeability regulator SanA
VSGSPVGGIRAAAARIGLDSLVYAQRVVDGDKWCWLHQAWHLKAAFGIDRHRSDGLHANCRQARSVLAKQRYAEKIARRGYEAAYAAR